ncbi:deoxyribodipyrimidine photo-lyase [Thalassolituus sp.]|uniref:deoxyribodipyrimidine photo-lyase n=1 Tax=Thalassolituus sp. TaxID=2030822 RepID=UPI00351209D8
MWNLVWFKRDLRLHDHAALWHAQQNPIIALYIFEPDYWALSDTSQRQWAFTREALLDLDQQLQRYGGRLLCMAGRAEHCLNQLLDHLDTPVVVHSHEETGNLWTYDRDKRIKALLRERSDNPRVACNE